MCLPTHAPCAFRPPPALPSTSRLHAAASTASSIMAPPKPAPASASAPSTKGPAKLPTAPTVLTSANPRAAASRSSSAASQLRSRGAEGELPGDPRVSLCLCAHLKKGP